MKKQDAQVASCFFYRDRRAGTKIKPRAGAEDLAGSCRASPAAAYSLVRTLPTGAVLCQVEQL
jgi:hypothetical protein